MKSGRPVAWLQAGEEDDEVARLRAAEAERAAGAAAVVAIRWRRRGEVGVDVDGSCSPRAWRVRLEVRKIAEPEHRASPGLCLGDGDCAKVPSANSGERAAWDAFTPTLARKTATGSILN